jgi:uncharacterized SAM-binding protein YcdF (DUF218 family)
VLIGGPCAVREFFALAYSGSGSWLDARGEIMTYTEPLLVVCYLVILTGIVRARRGAGRLTILGLLAVLLVSWPPADWLLSRPLEARYPVRPFSGAPAAQAIVVLASAVDPPHFERPYALEGAETFARTEMGVWLYRNWRPLPVLVCGGGEPGKPAPAEAMRDHLLRAGVPADRIWIETQSQSTYENAALGGEILRHRGVRSIVLIVEARSMPRAAACFRKQGFEVAPAVSEFREFGPWHVELLPSWKAIRRNEGVLHEALGYAWYWLRGRV